MGKYTRSGKFDQKEEKTGYHSRHEEDDSFQGSSHSDHDPADGITVNDTSCDSIQLSDQGVDPSDPSLLSDPDASITGIIDEMFCSSNAANVLADTSLLSNISTPPRHLDIPTDLETEDGVPFGRSHHDERFLQHHENELSQQSPNILQPCFSPHASLITTPPIDRVRLIILSTSIFLHLRLRMALLLLHPAGFQACNSVLHCLDDQPTWRESKRPEKPKEKRR